MTSRRLVDPELLPLLDALPVLAIGPDNYHDAREQMRSFSQPGDGGAAIEVVTVAGPAGAPDIQLRLIRPPQASAPLPVIYHVHGGGYIAGSAELSDVSNGQIAVELGCAIVSVDYRLAPETAFPGAIEDCYAGLAWLFANAAEHGFDPARIGVMGESAGGGLAASLALLARDRGEYRLAFQHLVYPMLDDRTGSGIDPSPHVGAFIWTPDSNRFGWAALLGHAPGIAGVSPYAAAARATDLAGLPPSFLYTGTLDLFLEENVDYARRLACAGVPVEFHLFPGAFHGFEMAAEAAISRQARIIRLAALRRALAG